MIRIIVAKKLPIVVGGTGFYIKSLFEGVPSAGIPADQKLRHELEKLSVAELFAKLKSIDYKKASSLNQSDSKNPRRLIRAIEISLNREKLITVNREPLTVNYLIIGLTAPNSYLYSRSDKWLETRLKRGLIEEVKRLLRKSAYSSSERKRVEKYQLVSSRPFDKLRARTVDIPTWLENLGLEYRWLTRYLLGQIDQEEAITRLKGDTHSFIRRQKTWFRQFPQISIFDISKPDWRQKLEKTVQDWYDTYRQWAKKNNPSE